MEINFKYSSNVAIVATIGIIYSCSKCIYLNLTPSSISRRFHCRNSLIMYTCIIYITDASLLAHDVSSIETIIEISSFSWTIKGYDEREFIGTHKSS
jgi:hypothetical protein